MAINATDVKVLKSQRLIDEVDGGGRATGEAVIDGRSNNLFPDISRLDRTVGRIALRKAFAGLMTETADVYSGAVGIITDAPVDPLVSVLLFNTDSQTDMRADAQNAIESYVVPAVAAPFELLGNQLAGQRAIACFQREQQRVPEIGQVVQLVSSVPAGSQYVRITGVDARIEEFTYSYGNGNFVSFTRRRLDLSISAPLQQLFPGGQPTPAGAESTSMTGQPKSQVLSTQVADAARYYGISKLAAAVNAGALTLQVQSVYAQLVPSTRKENALIDQLAGNRRRIVLASGPARTVPVTVVLVSGTQSRTFLGTACAPGTLNLSANGGVYADDSKGGLRYVSGSNWISQGSIDYETGELNFTRAGSAWTGAASATYQPGAAASDEVVTGEIPVTLTNRGYVYTLSLADAKPRAGTLEISYMALGKWHVISDPGNGELTGEGAGTIVFATGSVSITLNALPDVNSSVVYQYVGANEQATTQRTGSATARARVRRTLPHQGLKPGSYSATYKVGGVTKTVTDAGNGILAGDATGIINYAAGSVDMLLAATPDVADGIVHSYEYGAFTDESLLVTSDGSGVASGTIPGAPLKPGSVQVGWTTTRRQAVPGVASKPSGQLPIFESTVSVDNIARDNGAGGWVGFTGTLNYSTGAFTLKVANTYSFTEYTYYNEAVGVGPGNGPLRLATTQVDLVEGFGGTLAVRSQSNSASYGPSVDAQGQVPVTLDLLPGVADAIVPGSLLFSWGGEIYVDRDGMLFKGISTSTNAGTAVGSVDYAGRTATLTSYPAGADNVVNLLGCLTSNAGFAVNGMVFRTPGAPLRSNSMQVTAVRVDTGAVVIATADANGVFDHPVIKGTCDVATGIARLRFTSDLDDVTGASDIPVIPLLLRYNAVVLTSLPMDAKLLGLDPVRLPADGRVPIYREGDVLIVHHTAETVIASPTAGGTVTLARAEQAAITVVDSNGVPLVETSYSVDRELGTVTWANPLVLQDAEANALSLPLVIRDRVEHMTQCTEVQISGALGISGALPWDLPAGEAHVSSAVTWGDLRARVFNWFTQQTWNTGSPNWTDLPIGNSTTAQYNALAYPQIITNAGAIAGKWAIVFTSATAFQVVEEKLGVISTGNTSADCSPINALTGHPYFTIKKEGWGSGWAASNACRFNTDAALGPMWIIRTVISGKGTVDDDQFRLQVRGDAD